ncbi:LVIVD repeat-containing protein [Filimonas effusa]|uniref:LVIVD repeat-containing protein n=1 Tax=Filimonas effusa TaxID=2508721 RepID=A0A4Q1D250_9BACT|nr:hypothetical protein [Filimonas effusa]RXK81958.1 hypothetical protein ESB13_19455 [Filimonas effusa]
MKKKSVVYVLLAMTIGIFSFSCTKDKITESYSFYRPVYQVPDEVKASIKSSTPRSIKSTGKLAVRGNFIYLSELNKGVHIIDFSNPSAPANIGFVAIPGCVDLAVRDHYLYADCYTSLVVVDIADPRNTKLTQFMDNVFPDRYAGLASGSGKILVDWEKVDTVVTRRFDTEFDKTLNGSVVLNDAFFSLTSSNSSKSTSGGNSTGGSMARFALNDDRLYTVGYSDMNVLNVSNAAAPSFVKKQNIGGLIETIFPYKNNLFIGSQLGMYIYSLSNKDNPALLSQLLHVQAWDPVIADGDFAYVTLRGAVRATATNPSGSWLELVNVKDLTKPVLIKQYSGIFSNAQGLSKDENVLLVCDGVSGLKVFDATDPVDMKLTTTITGFNALDVIALNGLALVMAEDGLHFMDYTSPANIKQLSILTWAKN